jgi:hypothetical protein
MTATSHRQAADQGGKSVANAAHRPVVCVRSRMSFVTVLSASLSSIGTEMPETPFKSAL